MLSNPWELDAQDLQTDEAFEGEQKARNCLEASTLAMVALKSPTADQAARLY